jgi:hypothetical protein
MTPKHPAHKELLVINNTEISFVRKRLIFLDCFLTFCFFLLKDILLYNIHN